MKEVSADQIAAAIAGHPGSSWLELRLLMLFQSEARDRVEAKPESFRDDLRKAA
jgi:hypothetical protein